MELQDLKTRRELFFFFFFPFRSLDEETAPDGLFQLLWTVHG